MHLASSTSAAETPASVKVSAQVRDKGTKTISRTPIADIDGRTTGEIGGIVGGDCEDVDAGSTRQAEWRAQLDSLSQQLATAAAEERAAYQRLLQCDQARGNAVAALRESEDRAVHWADALLGTECDRYAAAAVNCSG